MYTLKKYSKTKFLEIEKSELIIYEKSKIKKIIGKVGYNEIIYWL